MLKCPRDGQTLAAEKYEGDVVVERCPSCQGVWLEKGELEAVQETREHDYSHQLARIDDVGKAYELARQQARAVPDCPACGKGLDAVEYAYCSQILIDRCAECGGTWLDAGEIRALERFFERETMGWKERVRAFFASLA